MPNETPSLRSPFLGLDMALVGAGAIAFVVGETLGLAPTVYGRVASYLFLAGSSSFVVVWGLEYFTGDALGNGDDIDEDTGWLIGKLENVLVLTFVFREAYTALSIVFAAKSFIRREDTSSENTTYYVAGTLLNFTYSVAVGIVTMWAIGIL